MVIKNSGGGKVSKQEECELQHFNFRHFYYGEEEKSKLGGDWSRSGKSNLIPLFAIIIRRIRGNMGINCKCLEQVGYRNVARKGIVLFAHLWTFFSNFPLTSSSSQFSFLLRLLKNFSRMTYSYFAY